MYQFLMAERQQFHTKFVISDNVGKLPSFCWECNYYTHVLYNNYIVE